MDNTEDNLPPNDSDNIGTPENPISQDDTPPSQDYYETTDEDDLGRQGSSLGRGPGKALFFGFALLATTGVILYYLFASPPPTPVAPLGVTPAKPSAAVINPAPAAPAAPGLAAAPSLPSAPPAPPAPPPPPPPPAPPAAVKAVTPGSPPKPLAPMAPPDLVALSPINNKVNDKRTAERMRSGMMLMSGNGQNPNATEQQQSAQDALNQNDPNAAFASNAIKATAAETVVATRLSNLQLTIAQGKIVNAILETAINTDLPGTLRAIISRDVFAEAGKRILIPKGSRLIGTYNTGILRGQRRVMIVWTRVIRPDGVDIMIGSPGVDSLGRAGVEGYVDNKYTESFSAAFLTSVISLGVGIAADHTTKGTNTTTTNTDGSTTNSGSAGSTAANQTVQSLGAVGSGIVNDMLDLRPTITIDQGTRINVFVNKDLIFPGSTTNGMFIE